MPVRAQFEVEFRKDGTIFDENQITNLLDGLAGINTLIVISHGWNNDRAEASALYDAFLKSVVDIADAELVEGANNHQFGVVRVYWPSKKFAESDLIPGGGAASLDAATKASAESLLRLLEELKKDPIRLGGKETDETRTVHLTRAQELVAQLDTSAGARKEFVQAIRAILNPDARHAEDASVEFFAADPEFLFERLNDEVKFQPVIKSGGATSVSGTAAASFIGDIASGVLAAARRIANFGTYYEMKSRAGVVGHTGAALLLARVREAQPNLPIHLVGHSFGGRLVTAAASTLRPDTQRVTMMLLQAAYSHNGLGKKFDGENDGAFRTILQDRRISGPVLITHTKRDRAVGIAYPLASRVARQVAAALGDESDPYGGMGRNGAQHTPEAQFRDLEEAGAEYGFKPGTVYNLRADNFISSHGDVTGHQVAYAFWNGVVAGE
jgi:hypothetical protein